MSFHAVHHFLAPSKRNTGKLGVKQNVGLELLIATSEDYIFAKILGQRFEAGNAVSNFETVDRFANKPFKNTLIKGSICFFVLQNCLNFGSQHYWE